MPQNLEFHEWSAALALQVRSQMQNHADFTFTCMHHDNKEAKTCRRPLESVTVSRLKMSAKATLVTKI